MAKFSELTDKAEKLVESGEMAKKEVQQCGSRVASASAQVRSAQKRLDSAKETDENGKPKGNVSGAQASLAAAQGRLNASRRALQSAKDKVASINAQKQAHVRKIEAHNSVEKNNLAQLKKLQGLTFAGNTEALYKGIIDRINAAEHAKASLNKSLGLDEDVNEEQMDEGFVSSSYDNSININSRTVPGVGVGSGGTSSGLTSSDITLNSGLEYTSIPSAVNDNATMKMSLVSSAGEAVNGEDLLKKYNEALSSGNHEEMNKYRTLYELDSFYNELDLIDGEEGVIQEGGLYQNLDAHAGYERHHIPSNAVQEKNIGELPAVTLLKEDHALTDSYRWKQNKRNEGFLGNEYEMYKIEASNMILDGKYAELVKAEVFNIIDKCGHKYDGGLKEYFQALYTMIERDGVPKAHIFPENNRQTATVYADTPMGRLTKYMSDHNYGIDDYEIYSKDPEWQTLHAAVYGDSEKDTGNSSSKVRPIEIGQMQNDMYVIKGDNFDRYYSYYYDLDNMKADTYSDKVQIETVTPTNIEGVHLGKTDVENMCNFWKMHASSKDFFLETASHIPEVRAEMGRGRSLKDMINDPILGKCASIYFDPENIPRVEKWDDFYVFDGDGRHRILAAREFCYEIPVRVMRKRKHKTN